MTEWTDSVINLNAKIPFFSNFYLTIFLIILISNLRLNTTIRRKFQCKNDDLEPFDCFQLRENIKIRKLTTDTVSARHNNLWRKSAFRHKFGSLKRCRKLFIVNDPICCSECLRLEGEWGEFEETGEYKSGEWGECVWTEM